jgi:mannose-6-phosphate isomerase-like protein (cupin superfamily)
MTDYRIDQSDAPVTHSEEPTSPVLTVVNLKAQASGVAQPYRNSVLNTVNDHCVRMAVMEGEFRWHKHSHSDECFLVIEGVLEIDLATEGETIFLNPGEIFTIPAGVVHRTRSRGRAVNLCFEKRDAYTDVIFVNLDDPILKEKPPGARNSQPCGFWCGFSSHSHLANREQLHGMRAT